MSPDITEPPDPVTVKVCLFIRHKSASVNATLTVGVKFFKNSASFIRWQFIQYIKITRIPTILLGNTRLNVKLCFFVLKKQNKNSIKHL